MATVIEVEETALIEEIQEITSAGHSVTVICDDDYEMAGEFLKELKDKEKTARDFFEPMVKAAYRVHKEVKARENEVIKPLAEARKKLGREMGKYQLKKEEERRAEQERLRIQQQKEADERALKEAARIRKEEEKALEEAARLEKEGKPEAAEAVLEDVPIAEPVAELIPLVVEPTAPMVEGTTRRTFWKYKIVDELAIPREYLCVDEKAIGAMVRVKKESTSIPGVRVYSEAVVS